MTRAAREKTSFEELLAGIQGNAWKHFAPTAPMIEAAARAISAKARSWAACLKRIFEVEPIRGVSCGVEMRPVAVITDDCELRRLLEHLRLPMDFPRMAPARAPPAAMDEETQVDPRVELWEGVDEGPQPDWAAA
ncbi:MAG: hypothetical protein HY927_16805 [Elusimicrobia bacterium]|nr:hypothetical protein [Elusimicrobiota bacterium]